MLEDKRFRDKVQQALESNLQNNDNGEVAPIVLWEAAKAIIRGEIISYATKNNAQREINLAKREVARLEKLHECTGDNNTRVDLKKMQNKLYTLLTEETEKALAFTRQKYYDNSPKSLKQQKKTARMSYNF